MKKKGCVICFVFVAFFVSCASSPKLFVPKQITVNMPDFGRVQMQEMLIGEHRGEDNNLLLYKMPVPGLDGIFVYSIVASAVGRDMLKLKRKQLVEERQLGLSTIKLYAAAEGPFIFIVDGVAYSLDDIQEDTIDTYVIYSKSAVLKEDLRDAILNCSELSIQIEVRRADRGEINISPDGLVAIKEFMRITPEEAILKALHALEEAD